MLYLTCSMILSVDLAHYGVSRTKDLKILVSCKCTTRSNMSVVFQKQIPLHWNPLTNTNEGLQCKFHGELLRNILEYRIHLIKCPRTIAFCEKKTLFRA